MTATLTVPATELLLAQERWQAKLDASRHSFSGLLPGASIGIVLKPALDSTEGNMLIWEARPEKMNVENRMFRGFQAADVDLLFVADDDAVVSLYRGEGNLLAEMKELIRNGKMLFYALQAQGKLFDLGYEDVLDALGLPFQGACR